MGTFASGLTRFPTVIDAHNGTLQQDWPGLGWTEYERVWMMSHRKIGSTKVACYTTVGHQKWASKY